MLDISFFFCLSHDLTECLYFSKLDFDAFPGPTYKFIVYAKDDGTPMLSSSVDVTITTTNVNDEKPIFIPPGTLVLRDVVPANFILTRLRATDADGDNVKFYFTRKYSVKSFCKDPFIEKVSTKSLM